MKIKFQRKYEEQFQIVKIKKIKWHRRWRGRHGYFITIIIITTCNRCWAKCASSARRCTRWRINAIRDWIFTCHSVWWTSAGTCRRQISARKHIPTLSYGIGRILCIARKYVNILSRQYTVLETFAKAYSC